MAKTTLWLTKNKAPDLFEALRLLFGDPTEYTPVEPPTNDDSNEKSDVIALIPWFSLRDRAFTEELCNLWKKGCRRFVLVTPTPLTPSLPAPWSGLPAHLRTAFNNAVAVCDKASWEELKAAIAKAAKAQPWAINRMQEHVEAWMLYDDVLSKYSHNSKADLSNQFLAPARLLASLNPDRSTSSRDDWRKVWKGNDRDKGFQKEVSGEVTRSHGLSGKELRTAISRIANGFRRNRKLLGTDLENLMALLTNIRVSAGVRTRAGNSSGSKSDGTVEPVCSENAGTALRVLVVDDHAISWRPVFEKLHDKLAAIEPPLDVCFEFSVDGKIAHRCGGETQEPIHFSYYDLVILDVFLGGTTGIKILNLLRRDFSQLPVLLWTTSRDEEITTEATLANGVLLKKTVTWESLFGAVARWVERGKAMRTASLPNPFFNHTIQNLDYRQLAVNCHEWCLKQLDTFHALDSDYFRFFTDHGGRHIVKLWELLEQGLQPFLQDENEFLLPEKDSAQREREILGLYLTVIFHELGMFPMRIGGKDGAVENFAVLGNAYLNDVRSLHAARGMVLLEDDTPVEGGVGLFWNDRRGRELGKSLRQELADKLAERVAILVGYHARLFKSLSEEAFLEWKAAGANLRGKIKSLRAPTAVLCRSDSAFRKTFRNLAKAFPKQGKPRERLRRQCALFRFVDALDVTSSRNPADFLIGANTLPPKQYGENLKRELCEKAGINNGDVYAVMLVGPPNVETLKTILNYTQDHGLMVGASKELAERACKLVSNGDARRITGTPWKPPITEWNAETIRDSSASTLQKPLDRWLEEVWKVLVPGFGNADFAKHLKGMGILDKRSQEPKLVFGGAQIIASITALSVAGELLDEYQAILDAKLADKIRLPPQPDENSGKGFVWADKWNKLPESLVTLKKVLPCDQREPGQSGKK